MSLQCDMLLLQTPSLIEVSLVNKRKSLPDSLGFHSGSWHASRSSPTTEPLMQAIFRGALT